MRAAYGRERRTCVHGAPGVRVIGHAMMARVSMPLFLAACRGLPIDRPPVWFMRQAGRSLPEYRALRAGQPMLETCRRPDLVTEITLQPVRRHHVDAAILFSDIVLPLAAAGVGVQIAAGVGPVIDEPIRVAADLERVQPLHPDQVSYIAESVRLLVAELGATPLIGFAGAPFTLASYLIEGGPSRTYAKTKALMHGAPEMWHALCGRLAEITSTFLRVQVDAGASAIQLFDSWAGALSEADYRRFVMPHSAAVLAAVPDVPRIHFGVGAAHLLGAMAEAGADVVGLDWRTPIDQAVKIVDRPVQGNLDPALLFAPFEVIEAEARRILAEGRAARGHVFNLGHGVLPDTDPDVLTRLVDLIRALSTE
jgi:uroporphyrinogen decarboxylase